MRRTKQWWAALTRKERSELHHLEYAMSDWMNRKDKKQTKCNRCDNFLVVNTIRICPECLNRRSQLIRKANRYAS